MEKCRWMIDVLTDLEEFSRLNSLDRTVDYLSDAKFVLIQELRAKEVYTCLQEEIVQ